MLSIKYEADVDEPTVGRDISTTIYEAVQGGRMQSVVVGLSIQV